MQIKHNAPVGAKIEGDEMGSKVGSEKISREDGYLYYVGKDGFVWAV